MTPRRWRPILVILMLFGFFGPWVPSCTTRYSDWGSAPHYLSEYAPLSGGVPTGDLGTGYFHPDVYFGFEVVWIYLLGFGHFLGLHTLFFLIGLGTVLVILYSIMSLSIFFHGTEAKARLFRWSKLTAILSVVFMALGWLQSILLSDKGFQLEDYYGYFMTFVTLIASLAFEFKPRVETQSVARPTVCFGASVTLIVVSLFLPGIWISSGSLPSSTHPPPSSTCESLRAFVLPADEWDSIDSTALQTWVESSPGFDNFASYSSETNLRWHTYAHSYYYIAHFKGDRLQSISVTAGYSGIPLVEAFACYGEPAAYLAYRERPNPYSVGLLLVQFWYPAEGIVLSFSIQGSEAETTAVDENLPMVIYYVQPGSIEEIADRAYLGIGKGPSVSFDYWVPFINPWPGSLSDTQEISE